MGKGLIGNSLSYVMRAVLKGEVSADDIDKIYTGTCYTEDRMLSEYNHILERCAITRAAEEICQKYGVEDIWDLEGTGIDAYKEALARADELMPQVVTEAETLLHKLWDEGRIIQTHYRVPEGQTVKAKLFPGNERHYNGGQVETEVEVTGKGQGRTDEILDLNGEYYYSDDIMAADMGMGESRLFNNEIELIANQLYYGYSRKCPQRNADRLFAFQKLFPQYKDAIEQVGKNLLFYSIREKGEKVVLEKLQEALKDRGEHTAEEIGEGIADLTQGEVGEVLNTIIDVGEPQKAPHTIE